METAPTRNLQKRVNAGRGVRLVSRARMPVLLAALILTFFASPARPIEVAPITVEIPAGQKTATLKLSNRNAEKATIQVRIFAWDQAGGGDRLTATTEMRTSPPFVTLPAGETQLVRVLLANSPTDKEASYRILIDEIPPPNTPGNIKLLLRISLPVFAAPKGRVAAAVTWRAVQTEKDGLQLIGTNRGTRRPGIPRKSTTPAVAH